MQTPATAVGSDSTSQTESGKNVALGQPPFPLGGVRRKSGWGKRFKEREQGRLAIIFPRRKNGEETRGSDAVWLSVDVLNSLSDRSLASAAKILVSFYLVVCAFVFVLWFYFIFASFFL